MEEFKKFTPHGTRLPPLIDYKKELPDAQVVRPKRHPAPSPSHIKRQNVRNERNMQVALRGSQELAPIQPHKPAFVAKLEAFLERELRSLNVESPDPSEVRLQAHREVFEYLIEDFKTYKPLLATIKNEYEMMLESQNLTLRQLEPLQQMLVTVQDQCDAEIIKHREKEKQDLSRLMKDNEKLHRVIDEIKNDQFALLAQVDRLKERLEDQYHKYRDEADARKLLVSDINDLRSHQEELIFQQQQATNRDASEDPVMIRLALKKAREVEKEATSKFNKMIADYGDVLPRADFENLQTVFNEFKAKLEAKTAEFNSLKAEHDELLETHKQVIKMRDEFYQESERLRQNATPRPQWGRCAEFTHGGTAKWEESTKGLSSDKILDILLKELAGVTSDEASQDFFTGKGDVEGVPPHLRFEGEIKNRKISRRDLTLLIKDIWKEKDTLDSQEQLDVRQDLSEFFVNYLKLKFPNDMNQVKEWCCNVEESCKRYSTNDEKISQFYGILHGDLDQEIYFFTLQNIVLLLKCLTKANENHEPQGLFTQEEFREVLSNYFGALKSPESIEALVAAALSELEEVEEGEVMMIEFTRLFFEEFGGIRPEDDEGKFGPFIDELKKQLDDEKSVYVEELMSFVTQDPGQTHATPDDFQRAFAEVDPQLDMTRREEIICWVFKLADKSEFENVEPQSILALKERLSKKSLKRATPRALPHTS